MVYDSSAQAVAIKAIGTVESNMSYTGIYYSDPITVGFMQWFGTRAASLLNRMRNENPSSWSGVLDSLTNSLNAQPEGSKYWTTRYLTKAEGESLKPVLNNNKPIQNSQAALDLNDYVDVAERIGMNKDTNTQAMIFFFVMYHQSPKRALQIVAAQGPNSGLDRLKAAALNEPVLGKYKNRYNTAYTIIKNMDDSGISVDPGAVDPPDEGGDGSEDTESPQPPDEGNSNQGGAVQAKGLIRYATVAGSQVLVYMNDGSRLFLIPTGGDVYIASLSGNGAGPNIPLPPDNPEPEVPPVDPGTGEPTPPSNIQEALVQFVVSRIGRYKYSQGASRLDPEKNRSTDCSALMNFAYKSVANINIGTYTGNQYDKGKSIYSGPGSGLKESMLQKGDLIFNGNSSAKPKHVEMYIGDGKTCGHGGPMDGPITKNLSIRYGQPWIWVRRHV